MTDADNDILSRFYSSTGYVCEWDFGVFGNVMPEARIFDPVPWGEAGLVTGEANGRGQVSFLNVGGDRSWVLRHYRRGGAAVQFSVDRYIWIGAKQSRPIREFRMLAKLNGLGLSVPRPVAARAVRSGISYRGDLITVAIPASMTLADALCDAPMSSAEWRGLGKTIAEMHQVMAWHADLNARNILIDDSSRFHIIDFDKARFRKPHHCWRRDNLARLKRSLYKFSVAEPAFHWCETDWSRLMAGYLTQV